MRTLACFLGLAIAGAAAAQSFTIAVSSPGVVQAALGPSAPLPVGPLASFGQVPAASTSVGSAQVGWGASGGDFYAYASASSSAVATSVADTGDWLIQATGPGPGTTHAALQLSCTFDQPAAGRVESVEIDVGNDGSIECSAAEPFNVVGLDLGPTPTLIRLHVKAKASATTVLVNAYMRFVPPMQTQVQQVLVGCAVPAPQVALSPGNDVLGVYLPSAPTARALVLGLSSQPQLLQPHPLCGLLIPRPDVVLFFSSSSWQMQIPTPAAVRPFSLWLQSVALGPTALVTGDAYLVIGQP